jgi:RNA polymerase sigma-70 factor, ECF subfamily
MLDRTNACGRIAELGMELTFRAHLAMWTEDAMATSVQPEPDDRVLMGQAGGGSEDAFCRLVDRHRRSLLNYFARMGACNHSEDLAQETFVRLWKYRKKYKPTAKFTTFLFVLARHAWLDHVRRQARFRLFADRYREQMPATSDGGMGRMRRQIDVQAALDRLTPKLREVLVLAVHQGLAYEEIAEVLRIPVGTVKSRVFNALSAIKETFHEDPR